MQLSWPRLGAIPSINFYDIPVVALILLIAAAVTGVSVLLAKSGLVAASVLSQTANPAITIGVLALFFAYVGLIVQGARQRFIWALAIAIFSPAGAILFSIKHWWRARTPAWIGISGIVLIGSGAVALAFAPAQIVISNHGDFEIDKPANWSIQRDLNPEANLQIGNSTSYLIAFSDSRRIVGATTLQDYAHEQTQTMAHGLEDANVSEPSTLVIDGHAAVEYVVRGVADKVDTTGIITVVETPSTFYRIISWTETRLFQNQQATLRRVIRSFRVRAASP
jgi:hypothetical protein